MTSNDRLLLVGVIAAVVLGEPAVVLTQDPPLSGLVLDVSCQPLPGVTVSVGARPAITTGPDGRFHVNSGPSTGATLHARLAGFRSVERVWAPRPGRPNEVRIFLLVRHIEEVVSTGTASGQRVLDPRHPAPTPHLHGRVLDENCQALPGAVVHLPSDDGVAARTDSEGRVSFDSFTSGMHDIDITADGFVGVVVKDYVVDEKNNGDFTVAMDRGTPREHVTVFPRASLACESQIISFDYS